MRRDELKECRAPEKENYSVTLKGTVFEDKRDWISISDLPSIACDLENSLNYF